MISYAGKPFSDAESIAVLNPYVKDWFMKNFGELTPPQKYAFKLISERKNLLITAPTGSGKTISGFLSIISKLFDYSLEGKLEDKVYCIYVSPLRALNNDVYRNLTLPLEQIYSEIVKDKGEDILKGNMRKVTIGVRTGDTTQQERRKMLLKPPNILVTTPESLAIILNSRKFMEHLSGLEYVIIDELHELANNKRGVHLSLSLERLKEEVGGRISLIGLGATLYPLDEAAKFLVGSAASSTEDCVIVDASWSKKLDVVTRSPVRDLIYTDGQKIEDEMYKMVNQIIKENKSTLIFTNTRSGTERVVFNLKRRFGYGEDIAAHHSSLSRESRMEVEDLLKKGALKCAVSSTSLELGVDIGAIEDVVQLGSPKSVTRAIQRIGRAGHSYKATAKGEMIALDRDDLVECTIMLDAALKKHLDSFRVPEAPLDVLAQHIIGMSIARKWGVDEAFSLVRKAYSYRALQRKDFDALLNYLAGNYVGLESRRVYGKIWYDEKEKMFGRRGKMAQVIYMLNLGTIPDEVAINVFDLNKKWIGNIEEEFLTKLKPGDIFTLGGRLYRFEYAKGMKCFVSEAKTSAPTIPPWFSEQLPLSFELAEEIGKFRGSFASVLSASIKKRRISRVSKSTKMPAEVKKVLSQLPMDENAMDAVFRYFLEQILFAKEVPNNKLMLVEQTHDIEGDKNYLVFHALFGRRVNDTLSRLFGIVLGEMLDMDVGILVGDNGFMLELERESKLSQKAVEELFSNVFSSDIISTIRLNIRKTEMMKRRFRQVAGRSFMILKNYKGWKISVGRQQVNSQLLLNAVEEIDPDFPVLKETYREVMEDVMDVPRAKEVIERLSKGTIKYKFITTQTPSPFAHKTLTFGHADVIMMKNKHDYLKELNRLVLKRING
ncbi:MAG: ATP-dependent helicase [Candidatus Marsarchaeota archaeon]|nr:ATP-dependent helicase [Candidatus Marsarchaeota archaeon]MCL5430828.1 ATP-dependent helicase [Candidatus Marsarchaeota archaeon]